MKREKVKLNKHCKILIKFLVNLVILILFWFFFDLLSKGKSSVYAAIVGLLAIYETANFFMDLCFSVSQWIFKEKHLKPCFPKISQIGFVTGLTSAIWVIFFVLLFLFVTFELSSEDPYNIQEYVYVYEVMIWVSVLPFWFKYERYCVKKLKRQNRLSEVAIFDAKAIRLTIVATASLAVIAVSIFAATSQSFAMGADIGDLQLARDISCVFGGFAAVLYPIIDMFILFKKY